MSEEETTSESKAEEVQEEKQPEPTVEAEEPAKVEERPEAEEVEEEIEIVEEKFYTVNLRDVWTAPRKKRATKAVRTLRDFVKRRMKVEDPKISNEINQEIWQRSIQTPPRKIMIRAVKDKEGQVIIFPAKSA